MGASLLLLLLLGAASPGPAHVEGCDASDVDCLRREYQRLQAPPPAPCAANDRKCRDAAEDLRDEGPVKALPWFAIAPAQWATTVATDCLPAAILVVAVVFAVVGIVLPGSTIPTLLVAAAGCGLIPCLPCVQGVATNAVGDVMQRGNKRGRLSLQMLTSFALLGVQLATAAVGLVITAIVVNNLLVAFVVPELRLIPAKCGGASGNASGCVEQLTSVSGSTSAIAGAAALGVLGIVVANVLIAALIKGPVLAASYFLHATEPGPGPAFLPRLVENEQPREHDVAVVSYAR